MSPLSTILLSPVKKLSRQAPFTSENSPKQFETNISEDFDVRGWQARSTFSLEEALWWIMDSGIMDSIFWSEAMIQN